MTNIFAQFAQPVRSIADYQAEDDNRALRREQLAGAQRNNALADLTAQQTRQTMEDQQRSNALIQAAYRSAQPGEGDDALIGRLQLGGDRGSLEYAQKLQEQRGKKAEIDAKTREAQAKALTEVASTVKRFATGVMANPTPQVAMQAIADMEAMHKQFGLPGNFDAQRKQIAEMTGPDQIRQWAAGHMGSADLVTKKLQLVNNGKVQTPVDLNPITNPAGPAPITMTTTPGEDLTATTSTENNKRTVGATLAGQRSVAETARLGRVQADTHFNASQDSAKWDPTNQVWTNPKSQTVTPGTLPNGQPMPGKMPPIEYQKQATAFQNMDDALANYKTVLSGFGKTDMLSPSKRAEMGQAYQNALLQAKEIYQLGVLNGGDERILKGIINSPLDVTSTLTPRDALLKQATDLQGILVRNNENMAKVHRQTPIPLKSTFGEAPGAAAPPAAAAKTGSGATVSKW